LRQPAASLRAQRSNLVINELTAGLLRLKPRNDASEVRIITAHHQDDLIETILMNLIRGTGWRGLAPMWSGDIVRPLLKYSKAELVAYAIENELQWAEDETNYSPKYFRNRLRDRVVRMLPEQRRGLLRLNQKQTQLRVEIEKILDNLNCSKDVSCCSQIEINNLLISSEVVGMEVLRKITEQKLTTPQLGRLLEKLKTAKSGDVIQPGGNLQIGLYGGEMTVTKITLTHPSS
jgi:tRNA(Ile)-lysidine synthase